MFVKFVPQLGKSAPVCVECNTRVARPMSFTITQTTTTITPSFGSAQIKKSLVCKTCGHSFADYERTGRLGCSDCYTVHQEQLAPVIRRLHA